MSPKAHSLIFVGIVMLCSLLVEWRAADLYSNEPNSTKPLVVVGWVVMGVALHPYIVGQPYRLRHLRRALAHLAAMRDRGEVWFTTPGAICAHMDTLAS